MTNLDHSGTHASSTITSDAAPPDSRLAQHIWRRYVETPGVIPLAITRGLARRIDRLYTPRLPMLEQVQQRWTAARALFAGGERDLPYIVQPDQHTTLAASDNVTPSTPMTSVARASASGTGRGVANAPTSLPPQLALSPPVLQATTTGERKIARAQLVEPISGVQSGEALPSVPMHPIHEQMNVDAVKPAITQSPRNESAPLALVQRAVPPEWVAPVSSVATVQPATFAQTSSGPKAALPVVTGQISPTRAGAEVLSAAHTTQRQAAQSVTTRDELGGIVVNRHLHTPFVQRTLALPQTPMPEPATVTTPSPVGASPVVVRAQSLATAPRSPAAPPTPVAPSAASGHGPFGVAVVQRLLAGPAQRVVRHDPLVVAAHPARLPIAQRFPSTQGDSFPETTAIPAAARMPHAPQRAGQTAVQLTTAENDLPVIQGEVGDVRPSVPSVAASSPVIQRMTAPPEALALAPGAAAFGGVLPVVRSQAALPPRQAAVGLPMPIARTPLGQNQAAAQPQGTQGMSLNGALVGGQSDLRSVGPLVTMIPVSNLPMLARQRMEADTASAAPPSAGPTTLTVPSEPSGSTGRPDVQQLAEQVSRIVLRQLAVERERRGIGRWY